MNLHFLRRTLLSLSLLSLCIRPVAAQNTSQPEIPRFQLSATAVGFDRVPELYWLDFSYDAQQMPVRTFKVLDVGRNRRGNAMDIPAESTVQLYRKNPDPQAAGAQDKIPFLEVPSVEEDDQKLLVFYRSPSGKVSTRFFDDSIQAHPPGTVRFANLIDRNVAVIISGKTPQLIQPATLEFFGAPSIGSDGRFGFQYAYARTNGSQYESPLKKLRFRSDNARLLVLFASQPETVAGDNAVPDENGQVATKTILTPTDFRYYDRIEPPPSENPEP